jgi:hypothetical protein
VSTTRDVFLHAHSKKRDVAPTCTARLAFGALWRSELADHTSAAHKVGCEHEGDTVTAATLSVSSQDPYAESYSSTVMDLFA